MGPGTGTGTGVLYRPVAVATPLVVPTTTTAIGMVRVTTLDPFVPHAAQLCVMVVCGILGELVGHTVMVVQYMSVTSCAGLVEHTVE